MSNYNIYYHICKYPVNNKQQYYNVRKFIINKNKGVIETCENYQYSKRNINKLKKDINNNKYDYTNIEKENFENIPYPDINH